MKLLLLIPIFLAGCENMDPATQAILAQGAVNIARDQLKPHRSGKEPVPPDGQDTTQKYDPQEGYNFGTGK